jgi:3-deoxy-D-manno-octulosonate 8-phosphate phosphatase (KDO 8-P phosphatase)
MIDLINPEIVEAATRVRLLLMDCDGVLTDGRLYYSASGEAMKVFHVRDGQGIVEWHKAGFRSGIISGRDAGEIVRGRGAELGIHHVLLASKDKVADFGKIAAFEKVDPMETAFIGDDLGDIELMKMVGFPVAVADAVDQAKAAAKYVTRAKGGTGAVRELIDLILHCKAKVI